MNKLALIVILGLGVFTVNAQKYEGNKSRFKQNTTTPAVHSASDSAQTAPGTVESFAPDALIELDQRYCEYLEKHPEIPGYRLLIFSESGASSQSKAKRVLLKFKDQFPDYPTYLGWQSPNYEVLIGDFRSKLEAERALLEIQKLFPFAYVKKGEINPPEVRKEDHPAGKEE